MKNKYNHNQPIRTLHRGHEDQLTGRYELRVSPRKVEEVRRALSERVVPKVERPESSNTFTLSEAELADSIEKHDLLDQ